MSIMGFLDKLKPDYRHSNPEVRLEGIKKLHDNAILLDVCLNDNDKDVRLAAFRKIDFPGYLPLIIARSQDEDIKKEAFERISHHDNYVDVIRLSKDENFQKRAIDKITHIDVLHELKSHTDSSLHDRINKRIEDLKKIEK